MWRFIKKLFGIEDTEEESDDDNETGEGRFKREKVKKKPYKPETAKQKKRRLQKIAYIDKMAKLAKQAKKKREREAIIEVADFDLWDADRARRIDKYYSTQINNEYKRQEKYFDDYDIFINPQILYTSIEYKNPAENPYYFEELYENKKKICDEINEKLFSQCKKCAEIIWKEFKDDMTERDKRVDIVYEKYEKDLKILGNYMRLENEDMSLNVSSGNYLDGIDLYRPKIESQVMAPKTHVSPADFKTNQSLNAARKDQRRFSKTNAKVDKDNINQNQFTKIKKPKSNINRHEKDYKSQYTKVIK